jgi:predicted DNA-binding protein (MmcQ/YjbR family)
MARSPLKQAEATLRAYALGFPDAVEEFPWDERVIKVGGKIFVFLGQIEESLRVAVKLPVSSEMALTLSFTSPTGYGLGRAGWVTARFAPGDEVPVDLLKEWIAQSYRAVAPRKILKALDALPAKPAKKPR